MSNLNHRVLRARVLAEEGRATTYDKNGRVKTAMVPGSKATQNHLIIRRGVDETPWISVECHKMAGHAENVICTGAVYHFCRHQIAGIFIAMWYAGFEPRFRNSYDEAHALAMRAHSHDAVLCSENDKPLVFRVKSHQGKRAGLWMVPLRRIRLTSMKRHGVKL